MIDNSTFGSPGRLSGGLNDFSSPSGCVRLGSETKEEIDERISRKRDMSKISVTPARVDMDPFDTGRMKRVVVYCRVSSDKLEQEISLVTQKNYYIGYVNKRSDMELMALYLDEGISATGIQKRKGLIRLLRDAKAGKFDIIIVKNLSRLSRNLMDCMQIIYMLRALPNPVGILFERENMFTLDKNIDFTLQILALVAQEESHKRSEAVKGAQRQRYEMGQFIKFDLLGYDRVGKNEIAINREEARTVQLIFMMYMAGCDVDLIVEVLQMLGRKKHSHRYPDGSIKEGKVDWTKDSVLNVLSNEKRCGHVDAQKTVTENYLDHKATKNVGQAPRYYAVDQHPAIINPIDFALVQKMVAANKGGWKDGLQKLGIYSEGILAGGVSAVPNWYGFGAEDYNRACLRAYGIEETTLDEIEKRINEKEDKTEQADDTEAADLPEVMEIKPDDYDQYFDQQMEEEAVFEKEETRESYQKWVETLREKEFGKRSPARNSGLKDGFHNIEYSCAELFSLNEKVCITLDYRGATFNKMCFNRMNEDTDEVIRNVELVYNPLEQLLFVRQAKEANPTTLAWAKENDGKYNMRRCCTKGISAAIYSNMGWNR